MKLYKYTLYKQNGMVEVLAPCKKKDFEEFRQILGCELIEIIPKDYYDSEWGGRCVCYGDEEGRFNEDNITNPHFKVIRDMFARDLDVVGDIIKEEVYKAN